MRAGGELAGLSRTQSDPFQVQGVAEEDAAASPPEQHQLTGGGIFGLIEAPSRHGGSWWV